MSGTLLLRGSRILAGALLLFTAASLQAQDRPLFPGQNTAQPGNQSSNDAMSLLLDQNNELRTELQALRALVEEQGFELRRLQRDSLSRYTNMDERLQALESGAAAPAPLTSPADSPGSGGGAGAVGEPLANPAATEPAPAAPAISTAPISPGLNNPAQNAESTSPAPPIATRSSRATSLQPAVLSEQQLYQMAYESAINSDFERSIAEFDQYLSVYPDGRFVSNAHYWKGQSYLYLDRFDEARDAYEIIVSEYGDSPKLPDAMYGLGQAWQGLGDNSQARDLYNSIKRRYPNTGVANLADTRLLSLD